MHTSIFTIENALEKAKERLKGVEENIKKSIGRDVSNGPPTRAGFKRTARHLDGPGETAIRQRLPTEGVKSRLGDFIRSSAEEPRSREHDFRGRPNKRLNTTDALRVRKVESTEERLSAKKRLGEQNATVTVFSRLSGPPKDDEFDEKESVKITSQVIVQDAPSRKDVLAAQNGDNQSRARNRRMFGSLLGTLQKFRQEENRLKEKEEKRAQVEKKLEDAALREKEELKKTRQELFSSRRQQQIEIRQLEYKLVKLKQLSEWESTKKHLGNFIQTKTFPKIYYLPKTHNEKTRELFEKSNKATQQMIEEKRVEVEKAIADHAATKKDSKEVTHDEEEHRDDDVDDDEEEEEEMEDESCKEEPIENMDIEEKKDNKRDDMNGVSDKENDVDDESLIGNEQQNESSPHLSPDADNEETA